MDPLTLMAMLASGGQGIESILQWLAQSNAQQAQQGMMGQNLQFQQNAYNQTRDAALAPRTDAYGNKMIYTPGIGWHHQLTDETADILDAEQAELLRNLTTDAARNRAYRGRVDDISRTGKDELGRTLNEYRYGERPNEAEMIDDLTRELSIGRQKGLREGTNVLGRQALRMNQGELIPQLLRQADEMFGQSFEENLLKGKRLGRQEYQNAAGFRDNQIGNQLSRFGNMALANPTTGIRESGYNDDLTRMSEGATDDLIRALQSTGGVSSAYGSAASAYGRPAPVFPISDVIGAGTDIFKTASGANRRPTPLPLK